METPITISLDTFTKMLNQLITLDYVLSNLDDFNTEQIEFQTNNTKELIEYVESI